MTQIKSEWSPAAQDKALAMARDIGPTADSSTEHRFKIFKWLNGLGLPSDWYATGVSNDELAGLYNSDGSLHMFVLRHDTIDGVDIILGRAKEIRVRAAVKSEPPVVVEPTPAPTPVATDDKAKAIAEAIQKVLASDNGISEQRVVELIKEHQHKVTRVEVKNGAEVKQVQGATHKQLPDLIKWLSTGANVMLVGPAGSGKTHAARQAAEALDVPFLFTGAVASEYKLTGFMNAQGEYVKTPFYEAFTKGALFGFDEVDASAPAAFMSVNAALSNGHADFPDGNHSKADKFQVVAMANTYGHGADRQYVGRNQLDAASLDRFVIIDWQYDEALETQLAADENWTSFVQRVRKAVFDQKIRHIVSPRASIQGAAALRAGISRRNVEQATVWKGMDKDTISKVRSAM